MIFMSVTGKGFQVEYPSITLHAISRAENKPSIYCQLDESIPEVPADDNEDTNEMKELFIIPQVAESCMYCPMLPATLL
jgi:chloride channel, nucleotide-sensitive, 1A